MFWNYRVVKRKHDADFEKGEIEITYEVYEAYYDDSSDVPHSITKDSVGPGGETLEELKDDLTGMVAAFDKPVLNYEDF